MIDNAYIDKGAILSKNRLYRYVLWRTWDTTSNKTCLFIGLNPSSADESEDDPTLKRCINFAKSWGFGRCVIVNLFAYRTSRPNKLIQIKKPIGYKNNQHIKKQCEKADQIIIAWGNKGSHMNRDKYVLKLLKQFDLWCFKLTMKGQPAHPLYQPKEMTLRYYENH